MSSFSIKNLIIFILFFCSIKSKFAAKQNLNFNYTVLAGEQNQTIISWARNNVALTIGMFIGVLIIIILLICIIACSIVLRKKYKNFASKISHASLVGEAVENRESRDSSDILS